MGSKTKPGERKPRPQAPTGSHVVRSLWIVDYGTQESEFKGVKKLQKKIGFTFELVNTNNVFKEENGPEPFVLSMPPLTKSLDGFGTKKSNLNILIDSWRGREMTDVEKSEGIDFEKFLDKPALATTISVADKKDPSIKYTNIQSLVKLPTEMKASAKPLRNKRIYFEIGLAKNEDGLTQFEAFELLPKFIQDKIAKSPEWQAEIKKHNYAGPKAAELPTSPEDEEVMHQPDADF